MRCKYNLLLNELHKNGVQSQTVLLPIHVTLPEWKWKFAWPLGLSQVWMSIM